ncbi:MAG: hypothetical protein ACOX4W_06620 [Bacilli bacterium]|jgi:hypothetical protein
MNNKRLLNRIKKMKTIRDWSSNTSINYENPKREIVKLCVIDNDGIDENALNNLGYKNTFVMHEFYKVDDIKDYNVILCDIKGVGQKFDRKCQGIAVAENIKKMYPEKKVILYSGQNPSDFDENYSNSATILDGFIEKGESTPKLVSELDKYCETFWNPVKMWDVIESKMKKKGATNKYIAYMEHLYVRSLIDKKNYMSEYEKIFEDRNVEIVNIAVKMLSEILKIYINMRVI